MTTTVIQEHNGITPNYGPSGTGGEFNNMSLEDIMFAVFTGKASAQTEEIKKFAAQVKHNTLRATNFSNLKAALDTASEGLTEGDDTMSAGMVMVNWQDEYGNHETIAAGDAMSRLGFSSPAAQPLVDGAHEVHSMDHWEGLIRENLDSQTNPPISDADKASILHTLDHPHDGSTESTTWGNKSQSECAEYGQVGNWMWGFESAKRQQERWHPISKADLEKMATEIDNEHSALEGQQQIDMAKLNKMFTDVQTSWNLVNGGIKSFGGLNKSTAQSVNQ